MAFYEYWIGANLDLDSLWKDLEDGRDYIKKFESLEVHLLRLTFRHYTPDLPLFNFEAIFKTVKGTFHDLKRDFLPGEYESLGPLFVYEVDRSSEAWLFLAQLKPLLLYASALISAMYAYQRLTLRDLEITEKKLSILKDYFPDAPAKDARAFVRALTPWGRNRALAKLIEQGLHSVELSKKPFTGDVRQATVDMVKVGEISKGS